MWNNTKLCMSFLQCYPTTIWFNGKWSPVTILRFKDFDVRQIFLDHFRNHSPRYYNTKSRIRFTPSSPLYQRKKECLIRAVMNAITKHPEFEHYDLTPLWHCLVLMKPQQKREYVKGHPAWLKLEFKVAPIGGS